MEAQSRQGRETRVGAGPAQLLAWLVVALLNQAFIFVWLPPTAPSRSLLHRAFDFGQLGALGAMSWLVVHGAAWVSKRRGLVHGRPWQGAALLALLTFLLGLLIAGGDVSNLAGRLDAPRWLLVVALSAAFALLLGATRLLPPLHGLLARVAVAAAGAAIALLNAANLPRDYFACHFMAAWFSASLIAKALEGLPFGWRATPHWLGLELAAAIGGAAAILAPLPADVQLRLQALPSSVLAPFIARLKPDGTAASSDLVPANLKSSPWFSDRTHAADVAPSRAIQPAKAPIVMFFTVDAFRADVMEKPELREQLPNLTKLRRESTYFTIARSPTASTMTTMASVFSGRYYSQLHWGPDKKAPLVEASPRFPELLQAQGVRTLLLAPTLGRIYGASGVARGFGKEVMVPQRGKPATFVVDNILADLEAAAAGPRFIYAHMIEPHGPYDLAGKKGTPFERYVREIGLVDRQIGRLRDELQQRGLADRTYLIISADHGEGFGEHGTFNHARTAYEELVRVPLFFFLPGRAGQELAAPVTLMDVGPTVLDLFGLPAPGFWMGQSLLPLVAGREKKLERAIAIDTGGHIQALCLSSGHKVIFTRLQHLTEVYDLTRDPGELNNLAVEPDRAAKQAIQIGAYFFDAIRPKEPGFESPEIKF